MYDMINLNELDPQVIQALNRMREPLMAGVLRFLEEQEALAKEKLVRSTDTVQIHRLQGRAEFCEDFLEAIRESSKLTGA